MAGKVKLLIPILLVCVLLYSAVMRINPLSPRPLEVQHDGAQLIIDPPFTAPQNVKIELWPTSSQPDSFRVSWDSVPGATSYRVYSAVAVPDSSIYIPQYKITAMPDGDYAYVYQYSKPAMFGDVVLIRKDSPSNDLHFYAHGGYLTNSTALFSPFTLDTLGVFSGTTYTRPKTGERDRFFYVTAVK